MIKEFFAADLAERTSFHVCQQAAHIIEFTDRDDLKAVFERKTFGAWYVLSGGNNVLFTSDYGGTIITPRCSEFTVLEQTDSVVRLRVGAGVEWDDLVEWAVSRGLWGIENLSLIPGKVGAAPVQNIGAYGAESKDVIESVEFFEPETMAFRRLATAECRFGYRDSIFKRELRGRVIITSVDICLSKIGRPNIAYGDVEREVEQRGGATLRNIRESVCAIRRAKLPDTAVLGNAGSFFKNPVVGAEQAAVFTAANPDAPTYPAEGGVKLSAGWLIDHAGLKGYTEGNVGIHDRQALVVVNRGGATGNEILRFAHTVCDKVEACYGVRIEPEVNIL